MSIGFPASPSVGQQHPTVNPLWQWDGTKWTAIGGSGVPATATLVTRRLNALTNTVDFIGIDGTGPALVAASVIADYVGAPPAATAPAALTVGQWSAEPTVTPGEIGINISALPSDGGSPITALQYRVGTGAAIALTGTGTGLRVVTSGFSAGVAADIQVRAVNAVGAGPWSDTKTRTPLAGGGGGSVTFVSAGDIYRTFTSATSHIVPLPSGLQVGHRLVVTCSQFALPTNITLSNGQTLTNDESNVGSIWSVVIQGSVPTSITVNLGTATEYSARAFAISNAPSVVGTTDVDIVGEPRDTIGYNTTAASAAVVAVYLSGSRSISAATFNGSTPASNLTTFDFEPTRALVGIHNGPTGANTFAATWTNPPDGGGRVITVAYGS